MSQDGSHQMGKKGAIPAFPAISQNQDSSQEDHRKTEAKVRETIWAMQTPLVGGSKGRTEMVGTVQFRSSVLFLWQNILGYSSLLIGNIA